MSQTLAEDVASGAATGLARAVDPGPGTGTEPGPEGPGPGAGRRRLLRFLVRRPGLLASALVVVLIVLAAFWPELFTSRDPLHGVPSENFRAPDGAHWFGTDELGRDVFSRVVHGAQLSLKATLLAVAVAFVVGGLTGLVAGFVGGWVEDVLMRVVDVLLSIPSLFLSLALVTALGYGTVKVAVAVGIASVAGFARVTRAEVLRVRQAVFVEASRSCGARWYTVLGRHVLPNAVGPVIVLATLDFGAAVLAVSSLSFLGYGAPPPAPEWGTLIADGRNYMANAWWLTALPGLAIAATGLAANRIARALDGEWSRQR
ncbi:ABC transporter permease [Streptomyces sp. NPDC060011]|uniref:ABC transporter permease n=1 Tax=unclassified Streptomyces TaxID=2593676 RepID=UPI0013B93C89|nr:MULTISPECIES: ABC transporter permease [unclassified Streptomyces]MCX4919291.1 ABC transporter permease [Streptomyces sp. NBC_00687]MCX5134582.1 ABC transporter permease [Streptomyces sp. NBC_00340]MCX5281263.1 ABC transporter permease [Streptomyces sp. NBC_00198]NEB34792.1 ABC transporter permease [Streptomyces sp. SID14446]WSK58965.1 ABC transporter permease [Streptomyces sp. NBC_01281]